MVKVTESKFKIYACKECGIKYLEKKFSEECEEFCKKNKACNLKLIKEHAVLEELKKVK